MQAELARVTWYLTSLRGKAVEVDGDAIPHLTLSHGSLFEGNTGKNLVSGYWVLESKSTVRLSGRELHHRVITKADVESEFLAAWDEGERWLLSDQKLQLVSSSGQDLMVFEAGELVKLRQIKANLNPARTWKLKALRGEQLSRDEGNTAGLTLRENGSFSGSTSANNISGSWKKAGAFIEFSDVFITERAVVSKNIEKPFMAAWDEGDKWSLEKSTLMLKSPSGEILLDFREAEQASSITGVLASIGGKRVKLDGGLLPRITLTDDGYLLGSTGANNFSGAWQKMGESNLRFSNTIITSWKGSAESIEAEFLEAWQAEGDWVRDETSLQRLSKTGESLLRFEFQP